MESLRGQLLIAGPALWDTNFRRTVVLIGSHDPEGAVGVILNRPSESTVGQAVPALGPLVGDDEPVFVGGPVEPESAVILAEFDDPDRAGLLAFGSVGFLMGEVDAERTLGIQRARIFAGYAGWAPGQLEDEMAEAQSWIPEPALPEDVFTREPDGLWERVVGRKGREFAFPADHAVRPLAQLIEPFQGSSAGMLFALTPISGRARVRNFRWRKVPPGLWGTREVCRA